MNDKCCEWCGHSHEATALCTQRPKWGRRGFLALLGMGLVGAALPSVPTAPQWQAFAMSINVDLEQIAGVWKLAGSWQYPDGSQLLIRGTGEQLVATGTET